MKNLFGWMLVVLLVLTAGVSCSDDEELLAGNGIADAAWSAENQVEIEGGVLNYTFAAASDWTARSSAYLVLEKLYRFITLSYLSLTLSGIECFSPAMPLHFGSKIGTSSLSTFFFR